MFIKIPVAAFILFMAVFPETPKPSESLNRPTAVGRVVRWIDDGRTILISGPLEAEISTVTRTFRLSTEAKIFAQRDHDLQVVSPAALATGDSVAIFSKEGRVFEIRKLESAGVPGALSEVTATRLRLTVRVTADSEPVERAFALDSKRVNVSKKPVNLRRTEKASFAELAVGQHVVVFTDGPTVRAVRIVPPVPVIGQVTEITSFSVTILKRGAAADATSSPVTFKLSPSVKVFIDYFGAPELTSASSSDVALGQTVSVYCEGGQANAISIGIPPVEGEIISFASPLLVVQPIQHSGHVAAQVKVQVDARTKVLVGHVTRATTLPSGKNAKEIHFSDGGSVLDLIVGRRVAVNSRNGLAFDIRVFPPLDAKK